MRGNSKFITILATAVVLAGCRGGLSADSRGLGAPAPGAGPLKVFVSSRTAPGPADRMASRASEMIRSGQYARSRPMLERAIRMDPANGAAWYAMARVQSRLGQPAQARKSLQRAADSGYGDLHNAMSDPDFYPLLAADGRDDIRRLDALAQRNRADRIADQLRGELGGDYTVEVDHDRRLVLAAKADADRIEKVKAELDRRVDILGEMLFHNAPVQYLTVAVLARADTHKVKDFGSGFYDRNDKALIVDNVGITLRHELVHALHRADMAPDGQSHPIWVTEGLATLFETSDIVGDTLLPQHNHRRATVQRHLRDGRTVPWSRFVRYSYSDYRREVSASYAQGRYMMMYIHRQGKLAEWYRKYVQTCRRDPSGRVALEEVFGRDIDRIEADWKSWLASL